MTRISLLRAADYRRTRWKNDGGWTTEIARKPAHDEHAAARDFDWRVSIAEIERDGPFSSFPGVTRDLLLLSGNGIELDIDRAPPLRLTERFQRAHFEGEAAVDCRLLAGPTRDFNVMTRRAAVRAEVMARPLVGSMVLFAEAGVSWLLHAYSGSAAARSGDVAETFASGDTLRIDFATRDEARVVVEGSGEIVLVKFLAATD